MNKPLYIYLAGNIKKGKEDDKDDVWSQTEMDFLQKKLSPNQIVFLNPATRSDDLSDQKSVFGRDIFQVYSSHLVLVDARSKRGLGVGAEMMFAKMNQIPVVSWVPKDSHYDRKHIDLLGQEVKNWIHPFVFSLSDCLASTLEEAASWIKEYWLSKQIPIKGPESIYESMDHYLKTQLRNDCGMSALVDSHLHFTEKKEWVDSMIM